MKKEKFHKDGIFHVFNKSIANYGIFKDPNNAKRFMQTLDYYNCMVTQSFSKSIKENKYSFQNLLYPKEKIKIKFICYCIMPDHYHLLVKMMEDHVFSKYMNDIENSFTRYFNLKFNRKGPLWQSDFKAVRIRNSEQLLHVSRYIHLNPTTCYLVDKPEDWAFSSYKDYIHDKKILGSQMDEMEISNPYHYKQFVEDQIDYQRKLKYIKKMMLDA